MERGAEYFIPPELNGRNLEKVKLFTKRRNCSRRRVTGLENMELFHNVSLGRPSWTLEAPMLGSM